MAKLIEVPQREIENKITTSGLRAAYNQAIEEKNWDEKNRLADIMIAFRKTGLWQVDQFKSANEAASTVHNRIHSVRFSPREVENKITTSGLRAAYEKAIDQKKWKKKDRLAKVMIAFRETNLWIEAIEYPQRDIEDKITRSGLRAAYEKAIAKKNWKKKQRLADIMIEFRSTRLWLTHF
ncbi:MAG: hypothetical protein KAG28_10105 [Cocleimonas sp.]|nr:hypothetical protein [Cocleimonas sp.]